MTQNLVLTIVLAVVAMGFVIAALSIGLILTGKSRLSRGCGKAPTNKRGDQTPDGCSLCDDRADCNKSRCDKNDNSNCS